MAIIKGKQAVPPTVERLEWVRRECGYPNLKAFWKVLTADGTYQASYEAARKYHMSRAAPAHYLARVANVCKVRLEWLATGEGNSTLSQELIDEGLGERPFLESLGAGRFFPKVPTPALHAIEGFLAEVNLSSRDYRHDDDSEAWLDFVEQFSQMLFAPFHSPRHFVRRENLSDAEVTTYTLATIAALRPLVGSLRRMAGLDRPGVR